MYTFHNYFDFLLTGPETTRMRGAITSGRSVQGQVTILHEWQGKKWNQKHTYTWTLKKNKGSIQFSMLEDGNSFLENKIVQINDESNDDTSGNKVGVFTYSQVVKFSNMLINCGTPMPCTKVLPATIIPSRQPVIQPKRMLSLYTPGSPPIWNLTGNGVFYRMDNGDASVALLDAPLSYKFTGSFFVSNRDDDHIGIVFGFKSASEFYIIVGPGIALSPDREHSDSWRILKVNSDTGPDTPHMREAINDGKSVEGQVEVLHTWLGRQWLQHKTYSWLLRKTGSTVQFSMLEDFIPFLNMVTVTVDDDDNKPGQIGMFSYSQTVKFFDMSINCG